MGIQRFELVMAKLEHGFGLFPLLYLVVAVENHFMYSMFGVYSV